MMQYFQSIRLTYAAYIFTEKISSQDIWISLGRNIFCETIFLGQTPLARNVIDNRAYLFNKQYWITQENSLSLYKYQAAVHCHEEKSSDIFRA